MAELAARGVKVDYVQVWRFVHAEGLSLKRGNYIPCKHARDESAQLAATKQTLSPASTWATARSRKSIE